MKKQIKNKPASVHDRLMQVARANHQTYQEVFYYYALERFLYRLARSDYSTSFVLKGGMMFYGWGIELRRPTRDIDLQGYVKNSVKDLINIVKDICVEPIDDGMFFDPESVRGEEINLELKYRGIRVSFVGNLGESPIWLHVDVSFANVITPSEVQIKYPTLLDKETFSILGYPIETAIAEKFEAMVSLGEINDRLKDFYDLWILSEEVSLDGMVLMRAIKSTFRNRNTEITDKIPIAFSEGFINNKQSTWLSFLKRNNINKNYNGIDISDFNKIIQRLREFLLPIYFAIAKVENYTCTWIPDKGWM
jgi:hypothetical protein